MDDREFFDNYYTRFRGYRMNDPDFYACGKCLKSLSKCECEENIPVADEVEKQLYCTSCWMPWKKCICEFSRDTKVASVDPRKACCMRDKPVILPSLQELFEEEDVIWGVHNKDTKGRPKMSLMAPEPIIADANAYTRGAGKYDERSWEKGMNWSEAISAMERHIQRYKSGEDFDQETGVHHLASARFWAGALITYHYRNLGVDDRKKFTYDEEEFLSIGINKEIADNEKS